MSNLYCPSCGEPQPVTEGESRIRCWACSQTMEVTPAMSQGAAVQHGSDTAAIPPAASAEYDASPPAEASGEHLNRSHFCIWNRWLARMLDHMGFALVVGALIGVLDPGQALQAAAGELPAAISRFLTNFVPVVLWVVLFEPVSLALFGTTPGKYMLGLQVRALDGSRPGYGAALGRSFLILLKGLGLLVPLIILITLLVSYRHVNREGESSWDRSMELRVDHQPSVLMFCVCFLAFLAASFELIEAVYNGVPYA